jgi:hypothetical protein
MTTTYADIAAHMDYGSWRAMESTAVVIIANAQRRAGKPMEVALGGGTRLMLELEHRISHDIDLFIRDPQWIGYLSPRLNDDVADQVRGYDEGADVIKLETDDGEIDFIVRQSLLGRDSERSRHTELRVEPVAEVMAKKLFYRGAMLTPRDLFDWHAVETMRPEMMNPVAFGKLLNTRADAIGTALDMMRRSKAAQSQWDLIQAPDKPDLGSVTHWAERTLSGYLSAGAAPESEPQHPAPSDDFSP